MARAKRSTLVDVAREAGVGTTTVSRVINGGHYVEAKTLARVRAVMTRLGYQPNQAARALKGERTNTLGLIIPSLKDVFFASVADIAQKMTRKNNYVLILLVSDDDADQEITELDVFQSHRVDGLLIVPPRKQTRNFLASVKKLSIPLVAIDRPLLDPGASSVVANNYEAARAATQHLIEHGRKNILCVGGDPELYTIKERLRGYEEVMRANGLTPRSIMHINSTENAKSNLLPVLSERKGKVDAVFALYNIATVMTYETVLDMGRQIPDDVALLGFDDFDLSSKLRPTISVVRQPVDELGAAAIQLLLNRLSGGTEATFHLQIGTTLVLRESCGCPKASL